MKVDATTPIGDLLAAVAYDAVLSADVAAQNAARAELARRSELAAKYDQLTRALAAFAQTMTGDWFRVYPASVVVRDFTGDPAKTINHNGTPDGIAAAIIAAAEASQ